MHRLILVRHASAVVESANDFDRSLNSEGVTQAAIIGTWLSSCSNSDLVLVSTAKRAIQTWKLIAGRLRKEMPVNVRYVAELYDASVAELEVIVAQNDSLCRQLMIVGHNPGIDDLAFSYVDPSIRPIRRQFDKALPNAAAVTVEFSDKSGRKQGLVTEYVTPELLQHRSSQRFPI